MSETFAKNVNQSPWRQGLNWLLLLGPLFFLSYGQVNQYTATRHDIGYRVFDWEHAIPFVPWTIIPYWSINLFYGISLFICTSKQELTRHGCRLVAASLIACLAFLLFPLRFTFSRPDTQGIVGWLFRQLEQFDLPYNQAPSLHIVLSWLVWLRFRQHLQGRARMLLGGWFLLIAASVLTTWQHHFFDVLSGFILSITISYAIPIRGNWSWKRPSYRAICLSLKYLAGSIFFILAGLTIPCSYILFWPAIALFVVFAGYAGLGQTIFQKSIDGYLTLSSRILLLPYLAAARLSMRWFSRHTSNVSYIGDGVFLGGFPENSVQQSAVLDVTAELHRRVNNPSTWSVCPLMDLVAPNEQQITQALIKLNHLRQTQETVLVCCALGVSRSATVVAAWLMEQGRFSTVQETINYITSQRPHVVYTPEHLKVLKKFEDI